MGSRSIDVRGRTALVTGASSGIGAAFAAQLARRGANLVLVARSQDVLESSAAALRAEFDVDVRTIAVDLSRPEAVDELADELDAAGVVVDALVNNAGVSYVGEFATADLTATTALLELNVAAVVKMTRRFLPGMIDRQRGTVINVSSTGAYIATPYMAAYNASKAFVLSFSQALWGETEGAGVHVLALCPGPTATPMMLGDGPATGREKGPMGRLRNPSQVVDTAFTALAGGRPSVVDGAANTVVSRVVAKILPERFALRTAGRMVRSRAEKATNKHMRRAERDTTVVPP